MLIIGLLLILSSLGVILARKPVYSALAFLATLLLQAVLFLEMSASFIGVMQVLVYAGSILVMFMFVIVLFQDAHAQIERFDPKASRGLLIAASAFFVAVLAYMGTQLGELTGREVSADFGTVQSLGNELYLEYFFPFEAITLLFLVAVIGALYIGRKSV